MKRLSLRMSFDAFAAPDAPRPSPPLSGRRRTARRRPPAVQDRSPVRRSAAQLPEDTASRLARLDEQQPLLRALFLPGRGDPGAPRIAAGRRRRAEHVPGDAPATGDDGDLDVAAVELEQCPATGRCRAP